MNMNKIIALIILALMSSVLLSQNQEQSRQLRKCALVIGNGNYRSSTLESPKNDAGAVATTLEQLGFKVYQYENLKQSQMKKAIVNFAVFSFSYMQSSAASIKHRIKIYNK